MFKSLAAAALAIGVMASGAYAQTPASNCPVGTAPQTQTTSHQGSVGYGPVRVTYTYTQTQQTCQPVPTPSPSPAPTPLPPRR